MRTYSVSSQRCPSRRKYVSREDFLNYLNIFKEEQGREVVIGVVEDLGESALSEIAQELPTGHDLLDDAANEPPIIKARQSALFNSGKGQGKRHPYTAHGKRPSRTLPHRRSSL